MSEAVEEPTENAGPDDGRAHPRRRSRSLGPTLAYASALATGAALRLIGYAGVRSTWLDESWLADNIISRDFAGLLRPLDFYQGAPLGFLFAEKLSTMAFGQNELALRLLPMAASIATLVLLARIGCRLGERVGPIAVTLGALAPGLIYYANEGKQYSVDVTVTLLMIDACLVCWQEGLSTIRAAGLALLGATVLWFSHPSVFTMAGVGTTLIVGFALRGQFRDAALATAASATWLASFAGEYAIQLRELSQNRLLSEFWSHGYLALPPQSFRDVSRYFILGFSSFGVPFEDYSEGSFGRTMAPLALALWAAGVGVLAAGRRWAVLAILATPLAIAVAMAAVSTYPLSGRLILFLSGPTLLTIAVGLGGLASSLSRRERWAGLAVVLVVLLLLVEHDSRIALKQKRSAGIRSVLTRIAREWKDGDLLVLNWSTEPPWIFYRKTGLVPGLGRVEVAPFWISEKNAASVARPGGGLKGRERTWVITDRHESNRGSVPNDVIFHALDASARRIEEVESGGCTAVLYDCR